MSYSNGSSCKPLGIAKSEGGGPGSTDRKGEGILVRKKENLMDCLSMSYNIEVETKK